jgi:hypothetical protein
MKFKDKITVEMREREGRIQDSLNGLNETDRIKT